MRKVLVVITLLGIVLALAFSLTACLNEGPQPRDPNSSCNEPASPRPAQLNLWNCHRALKRDSVAIEKALVGEWDWVYVTCFWTPEKANGSDFKCLSIEFNADYSLLVKESGEVVSRAKWRIFRGDPELYVIRTEPLVPQVLGRILFCDDVLEFNDSYVDGCDHYFRKRK